MKNSVYFMHSDGSSREAGLGPTRRLFGMMITDVAFNLSLSPVFGQVATGTDNGLLIFLLGCDRRLQLSQYQKFPNARKEQAQ